MTVDIADSVRLKNLPPKQRVGALDNELGRVNRMLLRRMQTRWVRWESERVRGRGVRRMQFPPLPPPPRSSVLVTVGSL